MSFYDIDAQTALYFGYIKPKTPLSFGHIEGKTPLYFGYIEPETPLSFYDIENHFPCKTVKTRQLAHYIIMSKTMLLISLKCACKTPENTYIISVNLC